MSFKGSVNADIGLKVNLDMNIPNTFQATATLHGIVGVNAKAEIKFGAGANQRWESGRIKLAEGMVAFQRVLKIGSVPFLIQVKGT